MSGAREQQIVLRLLRMAADSQPVPAEGHFVEDEELLTCWTLGLLGPDQHRELIDHLGICPACRRRLAELTKAGVLEWAEPDDSGLDGSFAQQPEAPATDCGEPSLARRARVAAAVVPARPPDSLASQRGIAWARLALAASVLMAIGGIFWALRPSGSERVLALAEQELQAGGAEQALNRIEQLLANKLDPRTGARAEQLLDEAGYAVGMKRLSEKDFPQVLDVERRVSSRTRPSARLENLRLQAERGIPAESSLAYVAALTDYGYELDGSSPRKALPVQDQLTERLDREYLTATARHPQDAILWINRGQFLLGMARYQEARDCFTKAQAIAPNDALVHLGLGLASFELRQDADALREFLEVIRLAPSNAAARLNLAVCLVRSGRSGEAVEHLQRALELTTDPLLRQRILTRLEELKKKASRTRKISGRLASSVGRLR